jgi:LEA14-like dessication related protein
MRMKPIRVCMLFAVALSIFGCSGLGSKMQAPALTIVAADMTSADVFSQQFRVRIRAENPNDKALPIKSIDYKLYLEGDAFAQGESLASFVVPANGEKEFDITVRTNFEVAVARLLSRINGQTGSKIHYDFVGHVKVDASFSPKLPFQQSGVVDLKRM